MLALQYDPNNVIAYCNIGLVYRKLERFEEAIEYFTKEIDIMNKSNNSNKSSINK